MDLIKKLQFSAIFWASELVVWTVLMMVWPEAIRTGVVLYDGIILASLVSVIGAGLLFYLKRSDNYEVSLLLLSNGFVGLLLVLVLAPVAIDRSLSLYLLHKIEAQGGTVSTRQLDELIAKAYPAEMRVRQQRVVEQVTSGNLKALEDGRFQISENGRTVLQLTGIIRRIFRLNPLPR